MLVSVALIAATIVCTRDFVRVKSARDQFDWLGARWEAGRVSVETVIAGSYPLMEAEESALWISKRAARSRHVARLKYILSKVESPVSESNPDTTKRRAAIIREEIRRYDPDAADEQTENRSKPITNEAPVRH